MNKILQEIEKEHLRKDKVDFRVGDLVEVHYRIREGDKERIQVFTGTVIAHKHGGMRTSFTVRRIVSGEGVERVFPLHSPRVVEVRVKRRGRVRRAKLYYLRGRVGKATRLRERRGTALDLGQDEGAAAPPPPPGAEGSGAAEQPASKS